MLQRVAGFCKRLFSSRGFHRGLRIFLGVFAVYCIYNIGLFIVVAMNSGASFGEALYFVFTTPLVYPGWIPPSASVALGIAAGLVLYFNRKKRNEGKTEPDEKAEESSDAAREEDFVETTHYKYH